MKKLSRGVLTSDNQYEQPSKGGEKGLGASTKVSGMI